MAIEKFRGKFTNEANGCTTLINSTVQTILDINVLGLYAYLCTKPDTWQPNPKEIMSHFGLTKTTTYKYLNKLLDLGLMTKTEIREKGRFACTHYFVHLHPQPPFPKKWDTVETTENIGPSPFPKKWDPVPPDTVIPNTYKTKIYTKQREVKNKETTSSVFDDRTDKELLFVRRQSNANQEVDEEEFLIICKAHVESRDKSKYNEQQSIAGLRKLISQGRFQAPASYQAKNQETVKKKESSINQAYQEYFSRVRSDINLKLLPESTKIMSMKEWEAQIKTAQ